LAAFAQDAPKVQASLWPVVVFKGMDNILRICTIAKKPEAYGGI
jgi:hypothetical protein